jgi:hypothetical protein
MNKSIKAAALAVVLGALAGTTAKAADLENTIYLDLNYAPIWRSRPWHG